MDPKEQEMRQLRRRLEELEREKAAEGAGAHGPAVRRRRPKIIAVFSYKGGVAKSTTVINAAATMAGMGRKTLVVDCDTQCNTSTFFYQKTEDGDPPAESEEEEEAAEAPAAGAAEADKDAAAPAPADDDEEEEEDLWGAPEAEFGTQERIDTVYEWYEEDAGSGLLRSTLLEARTPACNIYSALAPAFMARAEANQKDQGVFGQYKDGGKWKDIELQRISYPVDPDGKEPGSVKPKGSRKPKSAKGKEAAEEQQAATLPADPDMLWLLPGSPHLLRHEHNMSMTQHDPISVPYFAAFRRLIHLISEKEEEKGAEPFEYVFVDFGPSCTLLNKAFIMSCDYILPPVFCDSFSFESVHGFLSELLPDTKDESGMTVPGWLSWAQKRRDMLPPGASKHHRFNPAPPRILPFCITAFRVRGKNSQGVKATALQKQYARWAAALTDYVASTPPGPVRDCFILPDASEMTSCFLANLNSTMPVSHGIRMPLVYLNKAADKAYAARMGQAKGNGNSENLLKSVKDAKSQFVNLARFIIVRCRPAGTLAAAAAAVGDGGAGPSGGPRRATPPVPEPTVAQRASRRSAAADQQEPAGPVKRSRR